MADFNDETNDLIDNAAADLINASAKEQADEIRNETQGSIDTENSALQQNTSALNANTQAQKALNEEKQKTLTIQQALDKAVQESLKQRNEMLVYHGTGADFNKFSDKFINSGEGSQTFGVGHYFTNNKEIGQDYGKSFRNKDEQYSLGLYTLENGVDETIKALQNEINDYTEKVKKAKEKFEHYYRLSVYSDNELYKHSANRAEDDIVRYNSYIEENKNAIERIKNVNFNDIIKDVAANLYHVAIPRDTGRNYFDWETGYSFNRFLKSDIDEDVKNRIRTIRDTDDSYKDGYISGGELYKELERWFNKDKATSVIKDMGYQGVKYPAGLIHGGAEAGDTNYVVFNEDDIRIVKREDLLGESKLKHFEGSGLDTSLYNPVTYVDESLKSAIEGSNFDGARFILDIAEAIKQKIIPADGAKLASGSFVIGPDLENFTAQKVNDLILTNDGRAYITDKADNIIATKDLGSLGEGEQKVRLEGSREPIGILSNEDAVTFKTLADAIESLTSKKNILIESASALKGQEYQKNASNIDNLSVQIGKIENTKDKRLQIAADNLFKANEDYLENWFDNLADNFEKADKAEKEFADTLERVETYRKNEKDNEEKFNNTMFGGADDIRFRQTRGLLSEFYGYQSSINGMNGNSLGISTEEQKIQDEYTSSKKEIDSMVSSLNEYKSIILRLNEAINDTTISDERKLMYTQELGDVSVGYNSTLQRLNATLKEANERTSEAVYENNLKNADSGYSRRKASIDAKYAWRRDRQQTNLLLNEGYLNNYNTTGSLRESFQKTLFNKANGLRQRQGLTGFAANLGYNVSGVGLALGLGTFAKGIEKATKAALQFAEGSVAAYGELQSIKTNLGIVYSSQAQADQTFSEIAAYAVKSPFGVQTVSEYAVLLKQSGIYASDLMDTLKQIGDVAGGNQQKFANIANAFSQVEANGKATTRQLRQFATAGIPIYKELASQLGVGIEQIRKMTEEGKISASVIEEAFANLTGPGGTFENAVNIGAKTWKARQQNLADAKQLAQAQFGQLIIGFGGTGRNDSIAENILSIRESILNSVGDWAELKNIKKSVKNIETQESIVKKLQAEYDLLEAQGASQETLRRKKEEINSTAMYKSPDQQRANAESLYNLYEEDLKKEVISDHEYSRLQSLSAGILNIDDEIIAKNSWIENLNEEKRAVAMHEQYIKEMEDAITRLQNVISQSEYNKYQEELSPYMDKVNTSKALRTFSKGYEDLDKIINKGTKNIYSAYQKGVQSYEQSSEGQLEKKNKEYKEQSDAQQAWDRYSKLVDDNGRLSDSFTGTIQEAVELFNSGIITPLEEISFAPENLASDFTYNLAEDSKKATEQLLNRRENFNYVLDNLTGNISGLMGASDISKEAKTELKKFSDSLYNKVSVYGQEYNAGYIENTQENLGTITEDFNALMEWLNSSGNEGIADILSRAATKSAVTGRPGDIVNGDVYPLWQRALNQYLGTDLNLFKNKSITNGAQAVNLFNKSSQKFIVSQTLREMLNTKSLRDLQSNGTISYTGQVTSTGNNSGNTKTIDFAKTADNMQRIAFSSQSTVEETQAYNSALQNEINTLLNFQANAISATEEVANIYDNDYKALIGETFKSLEALDMNPFDLGLIEAEDGLLKFREYSVEAAQALIDQKRAVLAFGEGIGNLKGDIKSISDETLKIRNSSDIYTGSYSKTRLSGLSLENQNRALNKLDELIDTPSMKALLGDNSDKFKRNVIAGTVDTSMFVSSVAGPSKTELEEALNKAIASYIRIQDEKARNNTLDKNSTWKSVAEGTIEQKQDLAKKMILEGKGSSIDIDNYKALKASADLVTVNSEEAIDSITSFFQIFNDFLDSLNAEEAASKTNAILEKLSVLSNPLGTYGDAENPLLNTRRKGVLWNYDNTDVYGGNTRRQQLALNALNFSAGTQLNGLLEGLFDTPEKAMTWLSGTKENAFNLAGKTGNQKLFDYAAQINNGTFDLKNLQEYVELLGSAQSSVNKMDDTIIELGNNLRDTFNGALLDGVNNSLKTIGSNIIKIRDNVITSSEASDNLQACWTNVAQAMLDAIGPTLTEAGLNMIATAERGDKEQIKRGLILAAAGGVVGIASGMFGAYDESDTKDNGEEQRLQSLKDLLSDIIDQAKTDAEYYQRNILHKNAISANEILSMSSVNDAIIAPGGKVISTAPDDYLIATKTPGSLGGGVVVNFQLIDQSTGGSVTVKQQSQRQNPDGTIDIKAIVVATTAQAIADGSLDDAFVTRDVRINGETYVS